MSQAQFLEGLQCPIPISDYPTVLLAHGGGGRLTQMLIERMYLQAFEDPRLQSLHDGAVLDVDGARLAFSTDSFVISPIFFPGGDIGSLAVHGTVNDLSWRMLRSRVTKGQASGILCPEGEVERWLERLAELPLLRHVQGQTASYYTGATVAVRTDATAARAWDEASPRAVVWFDEGNILEADLPAPKPEGEA